MKIKVIYSTKNQCRDSEKNNDFSCLKKHFVYSQRVNIKNTIDRQVLNYEIHLL